MSLTAHAYERPQDVLHHSDDIGDGDIVILPNQGSLLILAQLDGERRLRKLTRDLDEVLDDRIVEEDYQALAQDRYARSVEAAWGIVNQTADTIIPYYSPRFRMIDCYLQNTTRTRELYRQAVLVAREPWEVIRVWYGTEETPENFVGLVFHQPKDNYQREDDFWSPTHASSHTLGRFGHIHHAVDELIRFDLAATRAEQE